MSIFVGFIAIGWGALSIAGSVVQGAKGDYERSSNNEMCAVLWFILAAVCLK